MKKLLILLSIIFAAAVFNLSGQLPIFSVEAPSSKIKKIEAVGDSTGIAYTGDALYQTVDNGSSWQEIDVRQTSGERIASAVFETSDIGAVVLFDRTKGKVSLARTSDGGRSWQRSVVKLLMQDLQEADLENAELKLAGKAIEIEFRIPTSSNFSGVTRYSSSDGGESWIHEQREVTLNRSEVANAHRSGTWTLVTEGSCAGFKTGCVQESKIVTADGRDITPPQVKELARREKENAALDASRNQMFAVPPGGATRISLNRGFDKCQAGSVAQMQLWWNNSYFFDSNIYMSGRNRACQSQPFTNNPAWIDQVSAMGWGLIPTIVGYQSPCTASATTVKFSYDPATAETQGRGEAQIAANDAVSIGLGPGTILYYDMERYDETAATPGCRIASTAFLKGWTDKLRELGYKSGTYGSPKNAQEDWINLTGSSRMDAIWMARWDNIMSVWTYGSFPNFPTDSWNNHQRIKQWQAPHNETWGGVTFNIDGNISDAPVAGVPVPRNKVGDFDGDGRTDITVFRPDNGYWYIFGSLGPTFSFYEFGSAADILAPGDFDGDGKTDFAVFRTADSTWYFRLKGGTFGSKQFGSGTDIPAPADFNGDGKTDICVFRPSTGTWYISRSDSQNTFDAISFGQDGDKPVPADYDGDGKADVAVYRPSDGNWYVQGSAGNFFSAQWGVAGDQPVQADYDGDGKVDIGVFRQSEGMWYIVQTTAGIRYQQFGQSGDIPTPGDFDGDGKYDVAVWRPSDGNWYLSQSQDGFAARSFGVLNDKPIPTAYLPR